MEKKYKITLIIIFTIILSIAVIGTGYFLYKNNLKKNSAEVLIDENLSINYLNGRKFEFNDKVVSEVMIHRTEIFAVDIKSNVSDILEEIDEFKYSRIPVYERKRNKFFCNK